MLLFAYVHVCAQTDTIRYVRTSGSYGNDGLSWATAMSSVQEAINDLRDYLNRHNLSGGSVYIAEGTYVPSESTEASGGSMLNTSFKIYEGIHVYGGFSEDAPESRPGLRKMLNGKTWDDNWASRLQIGSATDAQVAEHWFMLKKTILSGNHSAVDVSFTYDSIRGRFNTTFPANSYHVVWFATNGEIPVTNDSLARHFKPLEKKAWVDGCTIYGGNASSRQTGTRNHTGYGGGVYMVENSALLHCEVSHCAATLRGGGVYMDGGGRVEFCYIHTCQASGVGIVQGYGGAACIDYNGSVEHSYLTQSCARIGAGLAICHVPGEYPWRERVRARYNREPVDEDEISQYSPFCSASVISNNTSNAEGGGIYLDEGGTLNHCSVLANNCIGADVMYYGRRHGRSGGVYIRNCGLIYNSVFWGSKCKANNNLQFAAVRQNPDEDDELLVYHCAFMNHDITDWTNVKKDMVYPLERDNMPQAGIYANYPCFHNPTPKAGVLTYNSSGVEDYPNLHPEAYQRVRQWHPGIFSALAEKGVQVTDAMQGVSQWIQHAHTSYGVVGNTFEPVSSLGALIRENEHVRYAMIVPQALEYRKGETTPIPTIFVDPNRLGLFDNEGHYIIPETTGASWDAPIKNIGDAIMFFRQNIVEEPNNAIGSRAHYHLPSAWDASGNPTAYTDYDYVQILVKEGELNTAGPNNYLGNEMRTASIRMLSHLRLYGGYPKSLTGTNSAGRDPMNLAPKITANILGAVGHDAYENNSAHVLTYVNAEYAIVDGFKLYNGNAHNLTVTQSVMAGAGVIVNNETTDATKRIDMVGNELRNCRLANNSAPKGAAIYVNGEHKKRQGFVQQVCYAELAVVNCIIRNNTADYDPENPLATSHGVITANGRAFIDMDHCDVVNNVGFPFKADNRTTRSDIEMPFHGFIRVDNSLIFCNGDKVLDNRGDLGNVAHILSVNEDGQDCVFGTYNLFDADLRLHEADPSQPRGFFQEGYTKPSIAGMLPTGMPDAANHPLALVMPSSNEVKKNQCVFTRLDRNAPTYPVFLNPARNVGHSYDGDKPLFGGNVSYMPLNVNPCVNAASLSEYGGNNIPRSEVEDYDISDRNRRNYGGEPDVGAIENTNLPKAGSVLYVTPEGAGNRDGSSWDDAIAGNTVYVLSDIAGPVLAAGDYIDTYETCDRVLDSEGNPILTTNSKYNGGWGRVWIADKLESGTRLLTRQMTITDKTVYVGGARDGEEEALGDPSYSETTTTETLSNERPEDFVPGYEYDLRYPYGEISGASRTFWRANPYTREPSAYSLESFIVGEQANGWINNTRAERYVGGLQYAVEQASRINKTNHNTEVQVWIGAGEYTDYKGFVMRDSVTVLGGFPTGKHRAPGMTERQALMSNVINIPKSLTAEAFDAQDYECILQISDVAPKQDNAYAFNTAAAKFWDDDYTANLTVDLETTQVEEVTRKHQKVWAGQDETEVTTTYIRDYDKIYNQTRTRRDKEGNSLESTNPKNFTAGDEEWGGIMWTAGQKVVWQTFGSPFKRTSDQNQGWELAYEDRDYNVDYRVKWAFSDTRDVLNASGVSVGTVSQGMKLEGVMNTMSAWQTLKNVPAGSYALQIDLGAYYTGAPELQNTGITFYIIASNGDTLTQQPVHSQSGKLRRHKFQFTQPATGDLIIRIMSVPGTRTTDPSGTGAFSKTSANYRNVLMANPHLYEVSNFAYLDGDIIEDSRIISSEETGTASGVYTVIPENHRTTLRKRVLTMPDVCVPTYGGGGIGDPVNMGNAFGADALPHTDRATGATKDKRKAATLTKYDDPFYVEYNEVTWDGFTIRHGFLYDEAMAHGGGAGVNMYEGAHLRNCIVINNLSACSRIKGGGIFCDGSTSTIEGCFVLNNASVYGSEAKHAQNQVFAGGMFMYEGTCFNSLFANNYSQGSAGGLGFCVGRFFNNTVAYNTSNYKDPDDGGKISGGAISLATSSNPNLFVANTIIYGNNGIAIRDRKAAVNAVNPFLHCYIQSELPQPNTATNKNVKNWTESETGNYGIGNVYLNGVAPSAANSPFAADFVNGVYTPGNASATNDFRLRNHAIADSSCVNHGSEDFEGEFFTALRNKGMSASAIENLYVYQSVAAAELPRNDVAFANRVQDCQIDMGAYEYDGSLSIKPDTTTHPGYAIYYVAFDGIGNASGDSKENAACDAKLQQIIDAAGRYKHALMTADRYATVRPTPVAGQPDKSWVVQLRLAGDSINSRSSSSTPRFYTATRSTKHSLPNYTDNTLDYSFIIPHGVQVLGGYSLNYYHYEKDGEEATPGTAGAVLVDERDPLTFRTILSGKTYSSTGAEGTAFHVVSFTNNLFAPNQRLYTEIVDGNTVQVTDQLAFLSSLPDAEVHRTVVDGVFIEDGFADAPDGDDRNGAAAIVPGYVHIRNCVIQNNEALNYGGALYLKPGAMVSGSIIRGNAASMGGGIYVEQPKAGDPEVGNYARVFTSTICHNSASIRAGGLWFDKNVRVNSSVLWKNESNDFANVAGQFTSAEIAANSDYPFMFSGVEVRKIEGQGNVELSATETEGVRWDRKDIFNDMLYYPIEMSSTLARAGAPYVEWREFMQRYPTLDSIDISGVSRVSWNIPGVHRPYYWGDTLTIKDNDFIEIGARAVNRTFLIEPDLSRAMFRLYVVHTDLLTSDAARKLQDNTRDDEASLMYRQMGSSFLNPFHRLGDAFSYIITLRQKNPMYRNRRFEVFLGQGEYVPYRNAYGEEDHVHTNTFVIPEGVTVIGGLDHLADGHNYCQAGYIDRYAGDTIGRENVTVVTDEGTFTLHYARTEQIQDSRSMEDHNKNSVIEPWEFEKRSVMTGNTVDNDEPTHVYHVVTCFADSSKVGPMPYKYRNYNSATGVLSNPINHRDVANFSNECEQSKGARSIILDGVTIQGGYANRIDSTDYEGHPYNKKTYFRGGGIFVDGNWTEDFNDPEYTVPNVTDPAAHNILLVIRNCEFKDNMAGNGGAIYSNGDLHIHTSHFAQNYSQGPMSVRDQSLIPWTAGGCIATNAICGMSNCLFDNNEAKRGDYPITIDKNSDEYIEDSDVRQGFAGVISAARQSKVKAINCHFVNNKAVAYPAIFNFQGNEHYSSYDSIHLAFNCVFWGNEATGIDHTNASAASKAIFNVKYNHHINGIMYYELDEYNSYNRLYNRYLEMVADNYLNPDIPDTLDALRALADRMEGIYFCAYEEGKGLGVAMPKPDAFVKHEGETIDECRAMPMPTKGDGTADVSNLFTKLKGNHNVLVSEDNNANSGMHFVQPSTIKGVEGFEETADWVMARINPTTDNGWGFVRQQASRTIEWWEVYDTASTYLSEHFASEALALSEVTHLQNATTSSFYDPNAFCFPVYGVDTAQLSVPDDKALYNYYAEALNYRFGTLLMPTGTEHFMQYTREGDSGTNEMLRISAYPKQGIDSVFIDIGVYEYQYVQLKLPGSEVDTLWVTTTPRSDVMADGTSWERATDRLQDAIDYIMLSHNNHDKYICLLGGTYTPQTLFDNCYTFRVTVPTDMNMLYLPDHAENDMDYSIPSLTFLGGWSTESKEEGRNIEKYPTIIEMRGHVVPEAQNQLFVINDMTRQFMQRTFRAADFRRDTTAIPVAFDGITFVNPHAIQNFMDGKNVAAKLSENGGAAIYYRFQRHYYDNGGMLAPNMDIPLYPRKEVITGSKKIELPKLTISNCIFMDNGRRTVDAENRASAVRIDQGGGDALIVNSLFHSNAGAPIYAPVPENAAALTDVPNRVRIINSTFALNDGHITLDFDGSEIHNSLIWLDDLLADTLTQLTIGTTNYNKGSSTAASDSITNNAVFGVFNNDATWHNESMTSNNRDVYLGPNFVNPDLSASTSEARRLRDFHLNPAVRTMNMADTALYKRKVYANRYKPTPSDTDYWLRAIGLHHTAVGIADDGELAGKSRLHGMNMERGAYECQALLQRVLYVQPTKLAALAGDGSSWQQAFGQGQLQNAIDVASVYSYLNRNAVNLEDRRAFVFVKGSYDAAPEEQIIARDGVTLFGSLPNRFNDTIFLNASTQMFDNFECVRFANQVRAQRPEVAEPGGSPTRVRGVSTEGDLYSTGFVMDGFEIDGGDIETDIPPVDIHNHYIALRNCVIHNCRTTGVAAVHVHNGILYNSLVYDNDVATAVKVDATGLMLNVTVINDTENGIAIDSTEAGVGNVKNCIGVDAGGSRTMFAPYLTTGNPYTLPAYLTSNKPLSYQLHEHSCQIDAGTAANALPAQFSDYVRSGHVNYGVDRDILGNPRLIGAAVDNGAFETWRVNKGEVVLFTDSTNAMLDPYDIVDAMTEPDGNTKRWHSFNDHFGGNRYPHQGSVVYLMDSSAVTMAYGSGNEDAFSQTILRPGFMLMKPGSSFYGNGHDLQVNYLAVEQRLSGQRLAMNAFPFDYYTDNITVSSYNSATDALNTQLSTIPFDTYHYNGIARSAKDYTFQTEESTLWQTVDSTHRVATEGYLVDYRTAQDTVLRFNAYAATLGQYVYTEDGNDKTVDLQQYDNRIAGEGEALNFTRQEDMGWNMKGLPWLVSAYRTDTILDGYTYLRQMYIPHVFYQMNGAGEYLRASDQIYTSRSWDRGSQMSMGNAFFTQTATASDKETVIFHQPYYGLNERASRPILRVASRGGRGDMVTVMPDSTVSKNVQYTYGRDGVKWLTTDNATQIYLMDSKRLSRISLLGAAPTEVDIPLGISVPQPDTLLFSLPDKSAYSGYRYVWLIDYQKHTYTNLLEQDYTAELPAGTYDKRFAVRIGGFRGVHADGKRIYDVFTVGETLYVTGLIAGDCIAVYAPTGQLVTKATATAAEFATKLPIVTGYVVRVNDYTAKVLR